MFLKTFLIQNKMSMYCTGLESNMLPAVPQCTIEVRSGVETISTRTLISVLDEIGWSVSRLDRLARGGRPHCFCWIGGWKVCS